MGIFTPLNWLVKPKKITIAIQSPSNKIKNDWAVGN
jgi:hypothetical protein